MIKLSQYPTASEAGAIKSAGLGASVFHSQAASRRGRSAVRKRLAALGLEQGLIESLSWSATYRPPATFRRVDPGEPAASPRERLDQPDLD